MNSKAFIAGKLGRATLLFCMQCPQGRPAALKYLLILEKFLLPMPVSWDLGTVPKGICSHTDRETYCHPLSVPSVNLSLAGWIRLFIQSVLPSSQYLLKTPWIWHLPGAEDTMLEKTQALPQRLHGPGQGKRKSSSEVYCEHREGM